MIQDKNLKKILVIRRVRIYQRGNQNPYIEEEQTTQWPKENVQKDKQRSTKHAYKTKKCIMKFCELKYLFYFLFSFFFWKTMVLCLGLLFPCNKTTNVQLCCSRMVSLCDKNERHKQKYLPTVPKSN